MFNVVPSFQRSVGIMEEWCPYAAEWLSIAKSVDMHHLDAWASPTSPSNISHQSCKPHLRYSVA